MNSKSIVLSVALLFNLVHGTARAWTPYEPEQRQVVSADDKLLRVIGRLLTPTPEGTYSCTGTLVGPRHVLTAAHCVFDDHGNIILPQFHLGYHNGQSHAISRVKSILKMGVENNNQLDQKETYLEDWAILEIEDSLGERFGFLQVMNAVLPTISILGYSGDLNEGEFPTMHESCSVKEAFVEDVFHHDCDTSGGASGAAALVQLGDKFFVAGIHIRGPRLPEGQKLLPQYSPENPNLGVLGNKFIFQLQNLIGFPKSAA